MVEDRVVSDGHCYMMELRVLELPEVAVVQVEAVLFVVEEHHTVQEMLVYNVLRQVNVEQTDGQEHQLVQVEMYTNHTQHTPATVEYVDHQHHQH